MRVVNLENIVRKLPQPEFTGGASRAQSLLMFVLKKHKKIFCLITMNSSHMEINLLLINGT